MKQFSESITDWRAFIDGVEAANRERAKASRGLWKSACTRPGCKVSRRYHVHEETLPYDGPHLIERAES